MVESEYGVIKQEKPVFPVRELLIVPHRGGDLTVSYPAFGPNSYRANSQSIEETYSHPITGEQITFRPATTSESISAVAYDFENMAKPQIFDPRWLQSGRIVRTSEGVFTNTDITDASRLAELLNGAEKVNGIYIVDDKIAFASYDSFETGVQDVDTFTQGGLARALEHNSEKVAVNLREIGSPKHYKKGINVWGFDSSEEPIFRVAGLCSDWFVDGRLGVDGYGRYGGYHGCAFGVLEKSQSDAPEN